MRIFSGQHKNSRLQSPKGLNTRPTSGRLREALFNICQGCMEECRFLDLFAGSGAIGLEALSRGAQTATFVDNSKESIHCIRTNVRLINVEMRSEVIYGNVFDVLVKFAKEGRIYDIIYADPPYGTKEALSERQLPLSVQVLTTIDALINEGYSLLANDGSLFIEDAVEALQNIKPLQHLKLKSARRMGRAALHYYIL